MCCDVTQTLRQTARRLIFFTVLLANPAITLQVACTIRCYHVASFIWYLINGLTALRKNNHRQPWNTHFNVPWEKPYPRSHHKYFNFKRDFSFLEVSRRNAGIPCKDFDFISRLKCSFHRCLNTPVPHHCCNTDCCAKPKMYDATQGTSCSEFIAGCRGTCRTSSSIQAARRSFHLYHSGTCLRQVYTVHFGLSLWLNH